MRHIGISDRFWQSKGHSKVLLIPSSSRLTEHACHPGAPKTANALMAIPYLFSKHTLAHWLIASALCSYVGNINLAVTEQLLAEVFTTCGALSNCKLIKKEKVGLVHCSLAGSRMFKH